MIRTYSELQKIRTFKGRFDYLRLKGSIGKSTFGFDRYVNQMLYRSKRWRRTRDEVIVRDEGCDLGIIGYEIQDKIVVHHMNVLEDIENEEDFIFDPEFLVCTTHTTHMAIHYSDESLLPKPLVVRRPGDTIPWR